MGCCESTLNESTNSCKMKLVDSSTKANQIKYWMTTINRMPGYTYITTKKCHAFYAESFEKVASRFIIYYNVRLENDIEVPYSKGMIPSYHEYVILIIDSSTKNFIILDTENKCIYAGINDNLKDCFTKLLIGSDIYPTLIKKYEFDIVINHLVNKTVNSNDKSL